MLPANFHRITCLVLASVLSFAATAQPKGFHLKAEIRGLKEGDMVYLQYTGNNEKVDSVKAGKDFVQFKGVVASPVRVYLMVKKPQLKYVSFWLENAGILVKGSLDSLREAKISGSVTHTEYERYSVAKASMESRMEEMGEELQQAKGKGDTAAAARLLSELQKQHASMQDFDKDFIRKNPASHVSTEILYFMKADLKKQETEELYNLLSQKMKQSPAGMQVAEYLSLYAEPRIGHAAPAFAQLSLKGETVNLEQFRGKYVLLDFWGSWCRPCIEEIPLLVKLYERFRDKGFEIVAIAAETKREVWEKAIDNFKMSWVNLSELKGDKDRVMLTYGISYFPANFLIDPQGQIIGKDLHGEELENKLKEIFGN